MDKRKQLFKKAIDGDSCRRRREEQQVQIRKQKREESLSQRRRMDTSPTPPVGTTTHPIAAGSFGPIGVAAAGANGMALSEENLPMYALDMRSGDAAREVEATRAIRKFLSRPHNPPVEQILAHGFLPLLVGQISRENASTTLLFEASWALTNIGSTNLTRTLVDGGATAPLVKLLLHPSAEVREQCAWAVGNISGDCPELRDHVLQHGALPPLLQNILAPACLSMIRNCIWSLSNLCRGKPLAHLDLLRPALPVLAKVLARSTDPECLSDAGWALSYLCDGDDERIDALVETPGVCADLVKHLAQSHASVITPMLRTLGNIVSGDDHHTQAVVDAGALIYMPCLLKSNKKNIRKETCWFLSNVAAGNKQQVHALAMTKGLVSLVITQMATAEWEVRKEAAWVVANIATGGRPQHVHLLVELGAMKALCDLLEVGDPKVVDVALDALEIILKQGCSSSAAAATAATAGTVGGGGYLQLFHEAEGHERLEKLQEHACEKIYERAVRMIEKYLGVEEGEDEEGREGGVEGGGFGFQAQLEQVRGGYSFANLGH